MCHKSQGYVAKVKGMLQESGVCTKRYGYATRIRDMALKITRKRTYFNSNYSFVCSFIQLYLYKTFHKAFYLYNMY